MISLLSQCVAKISWIS